ncbi:hypothetical protein RRG08_019534 [Elysia crispata]|uniref:Uncharacterized protein n=1 Tax=Elysia crispata TaxID=231223 RepID=A0AAE1D5Z5_9GAST|nr:hypothetical protein RRG08_019534 [Elysia crispata]
MGKTRQILDEEFVEIIRWRRDTAAERAECRVLRGHLASLSPWKTGRFNAQLASAPEMLTSAPAVHRPTRDS